MSQIKQIIKRDGRTVDFDSGKIAEAIYKAAQVLGGKDKKMATYLAKQVELYLTELCGNNTPTVEQIQDAVEKVLIENGHARTAKEFILYRAERTRVRDMNTRLMKTYEDLTFKDAADNDIKRENANIDGDTAMGTMLKYGSEGAKQFYEMFSFRVLRIQLFYYFISFLYRIKCIRTVIVHRILVLHTSHPVRSVPRLFLPCYQ